MLLFVDIFHEYCTVEVAHSDEDSLTFSSNYNTDNSSDASSDGVCDIFDQRQPPSENIDRYQNGQRYSG